MSYAILASHFPRQIAGKANAALNILHIGTAFLVKTIIGLILDRWPHANDHYPPQAYAAAFGLIAVLQLAALIAFVRPLGFRADAPRALRGAGDVGEFR